MDDKFRKSPRQKKALSLKRDCRNTFGESPHAARKAIPLRKAKERRRVRHLNNQALSSLDLADDAKTDLIESGIRQDIARIGGWIKFSDEPLGVVNERKKKSRLNSAGRKSQDAPLTREVD